MTTLVVDGNVQTKVCTKCGEDKPVSEYYKHKGGKNGLSARCKVCQKADSKAWIERNREHRRAIQREAYARDPERYSAYNRTARYRSLGYSEEEYQLALEQQEGLCALCGKPPSGRANGGRLHADHDHETGRMRRLLCHRCNTGLGCFLDDPEVLRLAAAYVEEFRS